MSTIPPSLSSLLASNFSEFGRINTTAGANASLNAATRELRAGLANAAPGSNVTASYHFTVGPGGQLIPRNVTVTTNAPVALANDEGDNADGKLAPGLFTASRSDRFLSDLARPRADLSPEEELALFSTDAIDGDERALQPQPTASDENGDVVEVEIVTPQTPGNALQSLAAQRQQAASNLYARNNDIVYNVEPALAFAA